MNSLGMNIVRLALRKTTYKHDMNSLSRLGVYWQYQFKYPHGVTNYIPSSYSTGHKIHKLLM